MIQRSILFVDLNRFFGGGQLYLTQLTDLVAEGAEVFVICTNATLAEQLRSRSVRKVYYAPSVPGGRFVHLFVTVLICIFLSILKKIDTVWVNGIPETGVLPFAKMVGCFALVTRHLTLQKEELSWYRERKLLLAELVFRVSAPSADKIICVSQTVADDMSLIVSPEKLIVINNWIPSLSDESHSYNDIHSPMRLLFVGRLQKYKGVSTILSAMHRLRQARPDIPLRLEIVGEGRFKGVLETEAVGLDVVFAGFREDVANFYKNADIFINPSSGPEGLPLVSLEAMSFGLQCILSDLPVHKEISGNGEAALLFQGDNVGDLCDKLQALMLNPGLMPCYGRTARERIAKLHSQNSARKEYLRVLID